ncbi:MAG TPA: hypothetical protein VME63_11215 [Dyella sp.]|uniref:hypothetical protein n=1 Tax=Dyella sp. TaxID=1869338 RepID=UPI002C8024FB|nr:hypothetical protein [Dyella sp.]HTV85973.1 hypothetical protein [Dyella sp.]
MSHTVLDIKQAKLADKPYQLYDEKGMYLQVSPSGGKPSQTGQRKQVDQPVGFTSWPDVNTQGCPQDTGTSMHHMLSLAIAALQFAMT